MSYRQLLVLAFLGNGITLIGMKAVSQFGFGGFVPLVVLCMYTVAAVASVIHVGRGIVKMKRPAVLVGVLSGVCSALGVVFSIKAISMLPACVAFPLTCGGSLIAVAIIGRLAFKERMGAYGVAGVIIGTLAVILLSM